MNRPSQRSKDAGDKRNEIEMPHENCNLLGTVALFIRHQLSGNRFIYVKCIQLRKKGAVSLTHYSIISIKMIFCLKCAKFCEHSSTVSQQIKTNYIGQQKEIHAAIQFGIWKNV